MFNSQTRTHIRIIDVISHVFSNVNHAIQIILNLVNQIMFHISIYFGSIPLGSKRTRLICLSDQRAPTTLSLHCLEETDGIEPSLSVWNPYLAVRVFGGVYGIRTREIPDRQSGGVDHWPNTPKITCLSCKLCTCSLANSQTS